jgi:predicted NAD/FAD-binding protein
MKLAIIGGGISGLGAAWCLSKCHDVSLFEAADTLGGHSNTVDAVIDGRTVPVDTGFIVYNEPNYPNLTQLFAALDVETVESNMSFSVSINCGGFEYAGSPRGLFVQPSNLVRPTFWRFMRDLTRFYREARLLSAGSDLDQLTLADLLKRGGYSDLFAKRHLLPMVAAIWSSNCDDILAFPARTFLQFFENHGLLSLGDRPQWRSVLGGSRRYVKALSGSFRESIHLHTPIAEIRRTTAGVLLRDALGRIHPFDQVVLATHADQALAILGAAATHQERRILAAFRYRRNQAVLHCDRALMPKRRGAWSSWNYIGGDSQKDAACRFSVSYWMNNLQKLDTRRDIFVTLNPDRAPASRLTHGTFQYDHPQFDRAALHAQEMLPVIQGRDRIWFCGSYCGYGFHEDGLQSGLAVAASLGAPAPWANDITPVSSAWCGFDPMPLPAAAE